MVLQLLLGDHLRHVGYPLHVIWDLTGAKSLSCRKNEGRVFFVFDLQTVDSNQNKPPSLLGLFADPEAGDTPKSDINPGSAKTAKKHKDNYFEISRGLCAVTDDSDYVSILRRCQTCLNAFPAHPVPSTLSFLLSPNTPFTILCQRLLLGTSTLTPHSVHTVGFLYTQGTSWQKWRRQRIVATSPFVQESLREFSRVVGTSCV
ncbi:uncharacterized protein LOC111556285 [Felis catus]|uniref:uncharacterized protein LOC111556285 n=1 Tax=Felis catus TaxID=9685 RepID=UPI001D19FB0C|nr:uncharacterized protein LOC111556285 [Felis catus]